MGLKAFLLGNKVMSLTLFFYCPRFIRLSESFGGQNQNCGPDKKDLVFFS